MVAIAKFALPIFTRTDNLGFNLVGLSNWFLFVPPVGGGKGLYVGFSIYVLYYDLL